MLALLNTSPEAVLCFAVHYDCRALATCCLGTEALSQLGLVSRHCLAALRAQIAPTLFAHSNRLYDHAPNAQYFLAMMRFTQFCRLASHLWCDSFVSALRRFYLDKRLPSVACRLLLEAMRSVHHERDERCGNYCALCSLPALCTQVDQINVSGEALDRVLAAQPPVSLDKAAWYHDAYVRDVTQFCALLTLSLQSIACGYTEREAMSRAMSDMCMDRIEWRLNEWLRHLVAATGDIYTLASCSPDLALCHPLQRVIASTYATMTRETLDERLAYFYRTHVQSVDDWMQRPRELHERLSRVIGRSKESASTGFSLNAAFRLQELRHLCEQHEQYDNETLDRIIAHQMTWHKEASLDCATAVAANDEAAAVEQLVALLERRDAQAALARIFAPSSATGLARLAQQQASDTQAAMRAVLQCDTLAQSCDPMDVFLYQGVPDLQRQQQDGVYTPVVAQYMEVVVPVIASFDLEQLCEFLQTACAVFHARHWQQAIPFPVRLALMERYGMAVSELAPSVDSLHQVMRASLPCLTALQALDALAGPVKQWLQKALELFVDGAQRRMYDRRSEWSCPCGREFSDCVPEAVRLCEVVGRDDPLYIRLSSLESDYVETLMRQELALYGDAMREDHEVPCDIEYDYNNDDDDNNLEFVCEEEEL